MAGRPLRTALQHFCGTLAAHGEGALSDGHLLQRWAGQRDELAFEVLLRRHGPMVFALCRRLLGRAQDAEDAFQATFLVLVRKATAIHKRQALGSWLYKVAYRVALRARGKNHAAAPLEGDLASREREPADEAQGRELRPLLDEELHRLPPHYRDVVILCQLEGKSNEEAARELGCPAGTVRSRLTRARAQLRARLTRRGFLVPAAALTLWLTRQATATPPPPLVGATLRHALAATTAGPALPASVSSLCQGVLNTMFLTKVKFALSLCLVLGLTGLTGGLVAYHLDAQETSSAKSVTQAQEASKPIANPNVSAPKAGTPDTTDPNFAPPKAGTPATTDPTFGPPKADSTPANSFPTTGKPKQPGEPAGHLNSLIKELIQRQKSDNACVEALYLAAMGRFPTATEAKVAVGQLAKHTGNRAEALSQLLTSLILTEESAVHAQKLQAQNMSEVPKTGTVPNPGGKPEHKPLPKSNHDPLAPAKHPAPQAKPDSVPHAPAKEGSTDLKPNIGPLAPAKEGATDLKPEFGPVAPTKEPAPDPKPQTKPGPDLILDTHAYLEARTVLVVLDRTTEVNLSAVEPEPAQLGKLKFGEQAQWKAVLRAKQPFHILSAKITDGGIKAGWSGKADTVHEITITCRPSQAGGWKGQVIVETDHPQVKTVTITLQANVMP